MLYCGGQRWSLNYFKNRGRPRCSITLNLGVGVLGKRLHPGESSYIGLVSPKPARKRASKAIAKDSEESDKVDLRIFLEDQEKQ